MAAFNNKKAPIGCLAKKTELLIPLQLESIPWLQKINKQILVRSFIITVVIKAIMQMPARTH